jgi:Protein of unknown function (DUF3134)
MKNPSLRSQPRTENSLVFQTNTEASILGWLERSGRFMDREDVIDPRLLEEDEVTNALLGTDDMDFDEDDFAGGGDDED